MKAKKTYKAGGRAPEPLGMGGKKAKLKKAAPGKSARSAMFVEGAMNQMKANAPGNKSLKAPGKTVAEIEEAKKKNKRRRRFDNGGKVKNKRTAQSDTLERTKEQVLENARAEQKKKKEVRQPMYRVPQDIDRRADGPGYPEAINQEKASYGPLKKLKPKKASPVASKPSPAKKLKKSKAVIPVPPAKGRRRRNRK